MVEMEGARIHISGIVQGVGFRPYVFGLADRLGLTGWVRNTSAGVDIEVDGSPEALQAFQLALRKNLPPLACINEILVEPKPANGFTQFEIIHSEAISGAFQPISPDVSICPDCLRELFDPKDRRYRYPFLNCTNCGPRFTIIRDIPYDRPKTTMADFEMCPECGAEYGDPLDRRFHAQPVACPTCGPQVWLEINNQSPFSSDRAIHGTSPIPGNQPSNTGIWSQVTGHDPKGDAAIIETQKLLAQGKIVAIKGLGGFHLACDALKAEAVEELRKRKLRVDKPFALMMPDMETVEQHCFVNQAERDLLESRERPIVLLVRRPESVIPDAVAPQQNTLGVMLPYTPLHYLVLEKRRWPVDDGQRSPEARQDSPPNSHRLSVLVMTSGNISEEPIAMKNEEARERLGPLADAFLMHDRPIHVRCDDSVIRLFSETESRRADRKEEAPLIFPIRRARGYAPFPVHLARPVPPSLAVGAELKNTFCITHERYAFLSHHIGDMENYETLESFQQGISHFERLFRVKPLYLAYDLHPNYLATRYALERAEVEGIPAIGVQHHHAHIAACMAEHQLDDDQTVIGVAFDGTGYGVDGAIWGSEFLLCDTHKFRRIGHLRYMPLPGGDAAIRKPARTALAYLWQSGLEWDSRLPSVETFCIEERLALHAQLESGTNTPLTSSAGRLFDAVAALSGGRQRVNYEAQAAIEFEAGLDPFENGSYTFDIEVTPDEEGIKTFVVNPASVVRAVYEDTLSGVRPGTISARFHTSLARMILEVCQLIKAESGANRVVLSGGVWQNITLLRRAQALLKADGFQVYFHQKVPTNDGGVSLGQAAVAAGQITS